MAHEKIRTLFEEFRQQVQPDREEQKLFDRILSLISTGSIKTILDNENDPTVLLGYYMRKNEIFINVIYARKTTNWIFKLESALIRLLSSIPAKIKKINVESIVANDEMVVRDIFQKHGFIVDVRYLMEYEIRDIPKYELPAGFSFVDYEPELHEAFVRAFYYAFKDTPDTRIYPELKNLELTRKLICTRILNENLTSNDLVFGILHNRTIIGFSMLKSEFKKGFINAIGVIPEFQGRGFGKILMYESMNRLKKHGYSYVRLAVTYSNSKAYSLYRSLKFATHIAFLKGHRYL